MPDPHGFDSATAVSPRAGEPGSYDAQLHDAWQIGMGINGGLLLALAGRALAVELGAGPDGHTDPLSISAYYLSIARPGTTTVRTETLRRGRSVSTGTAAVLQVEADGRQVERLRAIATYGDLERGATDVATTAVPPDMPPPDRCPSTAEAPPAVLERAQMLNRFDLRLDPATAGWAVGKPSGRGVIRGWFRLPDGREPDPLMLLLAVDVLPPVSFDLGVNGWAPTLELTAHVRARPAPGWLRVTHSTRNFAGGYLEEDGEVWDSSDRLVAQSRQLARVRLRPRPG